MRTLGLGAVTFCILLPLTAGAIPLPELPVDFWPGYLQTAAARLGDYRQCSEALNAVPMTSRTVAPDRLSLLRAICSMSRAEPRTDEDRALILSELSTALAVRGSDTTALVLKGLLLQEAQEPEKAREALEDALWFGRTRGYTEAFITASLGSTYAQLDQPSKANELWAQSLGSAPEDLKTRLSLIEFVQAQGTSARARELIETGLKLHPDVAELQVSMAEVLLTDANRTFGNEAIRRARQLSLAALSDLQAKDKNLPLLLRAQEASIRALIEQGNLADARVELRAAQKEHPEVPRFTALAEQLLVEESALRAGHDAAGPEVSAPLVSPPTLR